ncbi:LuxR C-terminal-related transcriptional regulator [Ktedonospora formicarum]|uniref:DNA-binding response regulator n=1 Tax=Ktedonospora formicarum TaxID=2778364 RepID=A0A8J3MUC1_9CHLR|nr:response regulator transcription factor [Ktedonospora formicarum]GHO48055.1 DNA-binding response regulator [Ktedonospora formicarum]
MLQELGRSSSSFMQNTIAGGNDNGRKELAVQVVIVEAHVLLREGLQQMIRCLPQIRISACVSQAQEASETIKPGDVLVIGSSIGVGDCLECIRETRKAQTISGIVVIQQQLRPETAFPLIKSGAQGLLSEKASCRDLELALIAAASGNTFLDQRAREILNDRVSHVPLHFTKRELQVLPLLRLGLSNIHIAQRLSLKEKTVEKHLTHIYEKLQTRSRAETIVRIQALQF